MPFEIVRNDLTKMKVDAIVNPTDPSFTGLGGTDQAVHEAAGQKLDEVCQTLESCSPGQVRLTKGFNLPAKYIIHTVGPIWHGGKLYEEEQLSNCYKNSLTLAKNHKFKSIAFPLISSGTFGYPKDKALETAISTIGEFLLQEEMMVYLVVYDSKSFELSEKLYDSITQYIDDRYVRERQYPYLPASQSFAIPHDVREVDYELSTPLREEPADFLQIPHAPAAKRDLKDVVNNVEETFSQMLLRLIDEKGLTDADTYKRANIDRKLFSKIRSDIHYRPSKPTVLALAIAMQLNLDETKDLLLRAGFAISHSSKFDLIIEYFITEEKYNIFEINEALFKFDQNLLGV